MSNTRLSAALAVVVVVASVTGVTLLATPAAAQSDGDSVLGGALGEEAPKLTEDPRGWASTQWSALDAAGERAAHWARSKMPDFVSERFPGLANENTAIDEAEAVQTYWNQHNSTLMDWANTRDNWTDNHTVEIVWQLGGETATRYLEVNATDGNITRAEIVSSSNRTVDHDVELCGYAAASSREEIERFTETFAEKDKNVTAGYRRSLAVKYRGHVETSLYPTDGACNGDS